MDPIPAIVATGVSLALLLVAWLLGGRPGAGMASGVRAEGGAALAAASGPAALWAAFLVFGKSYAFPPETFQDWLVCGATAAAVCGLIASGGGGRAWLGLGLVGGGAAYLFHAGTASLHAYDWSGKVPLWVGGLAGATLITAAARVIENRGGEHQRRTVEGFLALAIAALAGSLATGFSGNGSGALAAGGLSGGAGLFGLLLALAGPLRGKGQPVGAHIGRAAGVSQAVCLVLLMAWGVLYASTPLWYGAVVALAPLLVLAPGGSSPKASAIRLLLVAAVSSAAPIAEALAADDAGAGYY